MELEVQGSEGSGCNIAEAEKDNVHVSFMSNKESTVARKHLLRMRYALSPD